MRQLLRSPDPSSVPACAAVENWLHAHPELRTVAVYSPLPGEVDLSAVILRRPDLRWVYPKICGHDLTFHLGETRTPGPFGILEPAAGLPEVPLQEIDAFLCPGLAFDRSGGRLGRGRGFYDRLLAKSRPAALKAGVCFDFQIVPDTFSEPHDIPMDAVLF